MATDGGLWEDHIAIDSWVCEMKALGVLDVQRVEDATRSGRPDVEGCFRGQAFTIENKACLRPSNDGAVLSVSFRPAQVPWMRRRWEAGGRTAVLLKIKPRAYQRAAFAVYRPGQMEQLASKRLTEGQGCALYASSWPGFEAVLQQVLTPWD